MSRFFNFSYNVILILGTTFASCEDSGEKHFREYQKLEFKDRGKALEELIESAKMGYPAACSRVADLVDGENFPHEFFGKSKNEAKANLLRSAYAQGNPRSAWGLGSHLVKIGEEKEGLDLLREACFGYFQTAWFEYAGHFGESRQQYKGFGRGVFFYGCAL